MVAIVLHELPVRTEIMLHATQVTTKNIWGSSRRSPVSMSKGTTPLSIQVAETMAMNMSMGTAGNICLALRRKPSTMPRRLRVPEAIDNTSASAVAPRRASWL